MRNPSDVLTLGCSKASRREKKWGRVGPALRRGERIRRCWESAVSGCVLKSCRVIFDVVPPDDDTGVGVNSSGRLTHPACLNSSLLALCVLCSLPNASSTILTIANIDKMIIVSWSTPKKISVFGRRFADSLTSRSTGELERETEDMEDTEDEDACESGR